MTDYFKNSILRKRPEFLDREDDIMTWIDHPNHFETQSDGRKKVFARDPKTSKWVRIILLEDGKTIHNIFFDRTFKG
jgi:hypothetical protein